MCGVSGIELVVVLAFALVVIGPDKLPEVMRTLGKLMRQVRELTGELTSITDELKDTIPVADIKNKLKKELAFDELRDVAKSATNELDSVKKSATSEIDQIRSRMRKLDASPKGPTETISNAPKRVPEPMPVEPEADTEDEQAEPIDPQVLAAEKAEALKDEMSEVDRIRARLRAKEQARLDAEREQATDQDEGRREEDQDGDEHESGVNEAIAYSPSTLVTAPLEADRSAVKAHRSSDVAFTSKLAPERLRRPGMGASVGATPAAQKIHDEDPA